MYTVLTVDLLCVTPPLFSAHTSLYKYGVYSEISADVSQSLLHSLLITTSLTDHCSYELLFNIDIIYSWINGESIGMYTAFSVNTSSIHISTHVSRVESTGMYTAFTVNTASLHNISIFCDFSVYKVEIINNHNTFQFNSGQYSSISIVEHRWYLLIYQGLNVLGYMSADELHSLLHSLLICTACTDVNYIQHRCCQHNCIFTTRNYSLIISKIYKEGASTSR
ncbi:hypothetical protein BDB01DRAFT_895123 [Pilobolus umbonatus]|nr:hypothetical protein BDB01DRAFT_895123 [Pilobolus umbonatus]